jgi:hypothetical protein
MGVVIMIYFGVQWVYTAEITSLLLTKRSVLAR